MAIILSAFGIAMLLSSFNVYEILSDYLSLRWRESDCRGRLKYDAILYLGMFLYFFASVAVIAIAVVMFAATGR